MRSSRNQGSTVGEQVAGAALLLLMQGIVELGNAHNQAQAVAEARRERDEAERRLAEEQRRLAEAERRLERERELRELYTEDCSWRPVSKLTAR